MEPFPFLWTGTDPGRLGRERTGAIYFEFFLIDICRNIGHYLPNSRHNKSLLSVFFFLTHANKENPHPFMMIIIVIIIILILIMGE